MARGYTLMEMVAVLALLFFMQTARGQRIVVQEVLERARGLLAGELTVEGIRSGTLVFGLTMKGVRLDADGGRPFLTADWVVITIRRGREGSEADGIYSPAFEGETTGATPFTVLPYRSTDGAATANAPRIASFDGTLITAPGAIFVPLSFGLCQRSCVAVMRCAFAIAASAAARPASSSPDPKLRERLRCEPGDTTITDDSFTPWSLLTNVILWRPGAIARMAWRGSGLPPPG